MLIVFDKIMPKLYLSITVAVIVGIAFAYTMIAAASFVAKNAEENDIHLSVDKTTVRHGDNLTWNANKLPPNAEYAVTLRWAGTIVIIGKGIANTDGEASDSFLIGQNLPTGSVTLLIELVSNPTSNPSTIGYAKFNIIS